MSYETLIADGSPVRRIILNRPEVRNAQNRRMLRELDAAFAEAGADPEVRVIVLSGAGDHFSAGHDVKELAAPREPSDRPPSQTTGQDLYCESHLRWRNVLKPTIAMVQGYCIFGGWMVASAMDIIFAADDAKFLAYPAPADYWSVVWELSPRKTLEILYENRFVMASEALELGFVNRLYPEAELERETLAYAQRVAENDPTMTRNLKLHVLQTLDGMGFSQSVRAAWHGYRNTGAPAQSAAAGAQPRSGVVRDDSGKARFRGVAPALRRLQELP